MFVFDGETSIVGLGTGTMRSVFSYSHLGCVLMYFFPNRTLIQQVHPTLKYMETSRGTFDVFTPTEHKETVPEFDNQGSLVQVQIHVENAWDVFRVRPKSPFLNPCLLGRTGLMTTHLLIARPARKAVCHSRGHIDSTICGMYHVWRGVQGSTIGTSTTPWVETWFDV